MIVRRHVILFARIKGIGQAVVHYIHEKIKIHSADGLLNDALSFAGSETRNFGFQQIGISLITGEGKAVFMLAFPFLRHLTR